MRASGHRLQRDELCRISGRGCSRSITTKSPFARGDESSARHRLGEAGTGGADQIRELDRRQAASARRFTSGCATTSAGEVRREGFRHPRQKGSHARDRRSRLKFTNLDKIYYPEDGYTKRDLLNYYEPSRPAPAISEGPAAFAQALSERNPRRVFFQKNTPESYPSWLRTETIDEIRYVLADDKASLLYLTNLGCIDQNPWMSRVGSLENPDYILIDLDPHECEFEQGRGSGAAGEGEARCDRPRRAIPKTTGGDGMHIYIPIEPVYTYDQARSFAEVIARLLAAERPDLFTTPRSVAAREKDRVYFDYLQIAESKTISAPYVARAYPGAPVSTPLAWE